MTSSHSFTYVTEDLKWSKEVLFMTVSITMSCKYNYVDGTLMEQN